MQGWKQRAEIANARNHYQNEVNLVRRAFYNAKKRGLSDAAAAAEAQGTPPPPTEPTVEIVKPQSEAVVDPRTELEKSADEEAEASRVELASADQPVDPPAELPEVVEPAEDPDDAL